MKVDLWHSLLDGKLALDIGEYDIFIMTTKLSCEQEYHIPHTCFSNTKPSLANNNNRAPAISIFLSCYCSVRQAGVEYGWF